MKEKSECPEGTETPEKQQTLCYQIDQVSLFLEHLINPPFGIYLCTAAAEEDNIIHNLYIDSHVINTTYLIRTVSENSLRLKFFFNMCYVSGSIELVFFS